MLADAKPRQRKYNRTGRKEVWLLVETSAPIVIEGDIYFVRVLYHTVEERLYLDMRKWKEQHHEHAYGYEPTVEGIKTPSDPSFKLFEAAFKLLTKHNKENS